MTDPRRASWLTAVLILVLVGTGCSTNGDGPTELSAPTESATARVEPAPDGEGAADLREAAAVLGHEGLAGDIVRGVDDAQDLEGAVDESAVVLRAELTETLQQHVYLVALAATAGATAGFDSPAYEDARSRIAAGTERLTELIARIAPDRRDEFRDLWQWHVELLLDRASKVPEGAGAKPPERLTRWRENTAAFFAEVTEGAVPAEELLPILEEHARLATEGVVAIVRGEPRAVGRLRSAAGRSRRLATILSSPIAQLTELEGDPDSQAGSLLADLSSKLDGHVWLTGLSMALGYRHGLTASPFVAATEALDENTLAVAEAVERFAPDRREEFLELWRQHIGFMIDLAKGLATGDEALAEQATADLGGFAARIGELFETASGGAVSARSVQEHLQRHVETMTEALQGLAGVYVRPGS